ncbi:ArsC family reductase [Pokkaliibacter sp. CJK22405]|uniref:ArsC family reductase n=1 Tax=Pokkaliibacter sp. CJK22405 TaxID=3384615 RepID=UPI003985522D
MTTLYGIKNCDTVKKARQWLDSESVTYQFHDYRQDGLNEEQLSAWCEQLGWETLLNKRSTTWRQIDDAEKADLDGDKAIKLMLATPSLIKRPLLISGDKALVGFNANSYQDFFNE